MKKFLVPLIMGAAMAAPNIGAQTVINLDFRQNPLFEISTDNVTAALPGDGTSLTLGADLTIKGGSGTYTYAWTDADGAPLGDTSSLTVDAPGAYTLTVSDQCECSHEVLFKVETAGIDAATISGVTVTVNGSERTIEGTEALQASLFSPSGVMTALYTPATPVSTFSFGNVEPGIYLMQIVTADKTVITQKIKLS